MYKMIVAFVILLATNGCEQSITSDSPTAEWHLLGSVGPGYYSAMSFIDHNNGWVIGDSGRISHTIDGGTSWTPQQSGTKSFLRCMSFTNPSHGCIGGQDNSIGLTTDGGISWTWSHPAGNSLKTYMAVSFVGDNTGWIVDNFGGILHTSDGGQTWVPQISGVSRAITAVQFLDTQEGWATAVPSFVLHTTNGGTSWTVITLDTLSFGATVVFDDIHFVNGSVGWVALNTLATSTVHPNPMVATSDGGRTWTLQATPEGNLVTGVSFLNTSVGWATAENGILSTSDGGKTWAWQLNQPDVLFTDICQAGQTRLWTLSWTGKVYRAEVP
jgi:photosystem II stability/assembly factor-like uncharacterized protein